MELFRFQLKSLLKQIPILSIYSIFLLSTPYILPLLLVGISNVIAQVGYSKIKIDLLPQADSIPDFSNNFVYFSYAGASSGKDLVKDILQRNNIQARIREFPSADNAGKYFAYKNLFQNIDKFNSSFAKENYCKSLSEFQENCDTSYIDNYENKLKLLYGYKEFPKDYDEIFIHINVFETGQIQNIPLNLTVEVIANTTMMDRLITEKPDSVHQKYEKSSYLPYWTGYGYRLQTDIERFLTNYYAHIDQEVTFNVLGSIPIVPSSKIEILQVFNITQALQFTILSLLCYQLASRNRGNTSVIMRNLGVFPIQFYGTTFVITFGISYIIYMVATIIWHFSGVLPYSGLTIQFCLVQNTLICISSATYSLLISLFLGNNKTQGFIILCLTSLVMFLIPSILMAFLFNKSSLFDPSLLPQWVTYLSVIIFPQFAISILNEAMISSLQLTQNGITIAQYTWKTLQNQVIITSLSKQSPILACMNQQTIGNIILPGLEICLFQRPRYSVIEYIVSGQSLVFLLIIIYFAHIMPEKGYVGLSPFFLFSQKFWSGFKKYPQDGQLSALNISLSYGKTKVIEDINLYIQTGEKVALLGESNQGKTTILDFITGGKRSLKSSSSQMMYGNFNLQDRYDAFFIKPFIGYCPQDFSNVILDLSVFENVEISLKLRKGRYQDKITHADSQMIVDILEKIGLGSPAVLRRKASLLSGGMLRRLACVNAIIGSKFMLIFDEISAGVDPVLKRKIWEIIKQTQNSVLITTHDMGEIETIARKINILHDKKLIVNDQTQIEFRRLNQKYFQLEIKLARNKEYLVPEIQGLKLLQDGTYKDKIQLGMKQYFDLQERLETLQNQEVISYYQLNRLKLEDIYNDIQYSLQENILQNNIQYPQSKNKILTMLKTKLRLEIFYSHLSTFYVIIILNTIIGLIFGACFTIMYQNLIKLNEHQTNEDKHFQKEQWYMLKLCYQQCTSSGKTMEQCMKERSSEFCGWYYTFIGFDQKDNYQVFLGDNVVLQNRADFVYYIVQNAEQNTQKEPIIQIGTEVTQTIANNYQFDWNQYFTIHSDPLLSLQEEGIYPYVKNYVNTEQGLQYDDLKFCVQQCQNYQETAKQCKFQFDSLSCKFQCHSKYQYNQTQLIYIPTTIIVNRIKEALANYNQLSLHHNTYFNYPATKLFMNKLVNQLKQFNPIAIVQYSPVQKKIVKLNYIGMFPNRGYSVKYYTYNEIYTFFLGSYHQDCQDNYEKIYIKRNIIPGCTKRAIDSYYFHEFRYRRLPYGDHVVLFDYPNNVLASQTSAIIRKQLYEKAIDYSPQNFSYNLIQREMPIFSDTQIKNYDEINIPPLFQLILFSFLGFMPFFFISQSVGKDYESNINRLLKFHNTNGTQLFIINVIYYLILTSAIVGISYLLLLMLSYKLLTQTQNFMIIILMSFIQSFVSIPTGIILGTITKSGKLAAIFAFSITVLSIVFCILNMNQPTLVNLISIILPAYSIQYIIQELIIDQNDHQIVFVLSLIWTIVQFLVYILSLNYKQIKQVCLNKTSKVQKVFNVTTINDISIAYQGNYIYQSPNNIIIQNANHSYDKKIIALNGVSFQIQGNTVFGLLGSNGSGKSTLMHALSGIFKITSGTAQYQNIDLFSIINRSNYFTMVPQQDILYNNLSVVEHLQLFIAINGSDLNINDILASIDIKANPKTKAKNLSGGEKRKLSLGIAMTSTAQIIALDEPSTGLGALTKVIVQNAIQHLKEAGKTIILTSHDLQEVEQAANQLILLKDGNILYTGTVQGMKQSEGFYFSGNEMLVKQVEKFFNIKSNCNRILFDNNMRKELMNYLQLQKIDPYSFDIDAISLEDEFMRIVE